MAMLGRKEPAPTTQQTAVAAKPGRLDRQRGGGDGGGNGGVTTKPGRLDRLREQFRNIAAELRKVTWPTPEETRNLTIVVIGLTAVVGTGLYILDTVFEWLYQLPR
jgi:preprotein translocase SecE subunit